MAQPMGQGLRQEEPSDVDIALVEALDNAPAPAATVGTLYRLTKWIASHDCWREGASC